MVTAVFSSPRARRRAVWLTVFAALVGAIAVANALLPRGGSPPDTSRPGRAQLVVVPKAVPLTEARRRAVDSVLDAFVPAAVERRDPLRALPLVTPAFRNGISRTAWAEGKLPVVPYDAAGERFHGWTLDYSLADQIGVDLLLRPGARETRGSLAFTAVLKRSHGRWLVDEFIPVASFAPDKAKTKRILAQPDFSPSARGGQIGGGLG